MKYRLLVRKGAKRDVRSAAQWYELQRPELGHEFVAEVDAIFNRIAENPFQYQVVHRNARRALVHRFPYGVFYCLEEDKIVVFGVLHLHQDPASWKARLTP